MAPGLTLGLVLLAAFSGYLCVGILRQRDADRRRAARFSRRGECAEADWLARAGIPKAHHELISDYMAILGRRIGVRWTRLRPEDSLHRELATELGSEDETLESIGLEIEAWLERQGLLVRSDDAWPSTIGDQLARILTLASSRG